MLQYLQANMPIITFLTGLVPTVLFFRYKMRSIQNGYAMKEFYNLQQVIDNSSRQLVELADRVRELEDIRTDLVRQINELRRENEQLGQLLKQLPTIPVQHDTSGKNPRLTDESGSAKRPRRRAEKPDK